MLNNSEVIHYSIHTTPVPVAAERPQSVMLSPPCFSVGSGSSVHLVIVAMQPTSEQKTVTSEGFRKTQNKGELLQHYSFGFWAPFVHHSSSYDMFGLQLKRNYYFLTLVFRFCFFSFFCLLYVSTINIKHCTMLPECYIKHLIMIFI